jgi:3-dehydroquinate synthase
MKSHALTFPSGDTTEYHFDASFADLQGIAPPEQTIIITDETVAGLHGDQFSNYRVLTFPSGEQHKSLDIIASLTLKLIEAGANRATMLVGVGGGVVTDVVGFLAATFMRGVPVAFIPTTLLAQVDAAIGGKNGVNIGLHKNMLGTIRQPRFILFVTDFLATLPEEQWSNGFAEIIKYGCIADVRILTTLQNNDITWFQKHPQKLEELIAGCVDVKNKIVHADELETGLRQFLNFGHTAGHALETLYNLPHGHAVGLGMLVALRLSEQHCGLSKENVTQLGQLLRQYGLPEHIAHSTDEVMHLLITDKKRSEKGIAYVLVEKPGVAITKWLQPDQICEALAIVAIPT